MVRYGACLVLVLAAAVAGAASGESPFPAPPVIPAPMPAPQPVGGVLNLTTGSVYVVNSKVDGALLVHPAGLVTVAKRKGPLSLDAVFVDAKVPGESETRDYAGPFLWVLKPVAGKSGTLHVTFVPKSWADEKEILHDTVGVNGGQAPQPPPKPPGPVVTQTGEWVIVVANETNPAPAQGKVLDGPTLRALKGAGKCRIYTDVSEADKIAAKGYDRLLSQAGLKSPALIVLDAQGKTVLVQPLPLDEATLATAVKGAMKP